MNQKITIPKSSETPLNEQESEKYLMAQTGLPRSALYLDRERSQIAFNWRVLAQAENKKVPLLERLRYLCIVSSNLDEFYEVRFASLLAQNTIDGELATHSAFTQLLHTISENGHALAARQYEILNQDILPSLAKKGIHLLKHSERTEAQRDWVKNYFDREVRPLLTPIGLDPSHPFPQVVNKSLNFIVSLSGKDAFGRNTDIAIVKAPRVLPRIIKLPDELVESGQGYCLLSSIMHSHIGDLFPEREILAYSQFRITRDSDLWVDEQEVKNLKQALQGELENRQFGSAVRLEVAEKCPAHLSEFLLQQFNLPKDRLYAVDGPVNLVRLSELVDLASQASLRFTPFTPRPFNLYDKTGEKHSIFDVLGKKDILLHHPFQPFQVVVDFIQSAAHDPNVLAIKQTIYRAGMNSELMESLMTAVLNGKEVTVVVELKARFDEQANINWADKLQKLGAQVVYGVVGLKTHAKLALVIRRELNGRLKHYAHIGTGNYHSSTTRFYTDFGLLTAHKKIASEVNEVFMHLTGLTKPKRFEHLWLAPFYLQKNIIQAIRNETRIAQEGRPALIMAKMNALVDEAVIRALYAASRAGVKIQLIVRGACTLRPGVLGLSDNISVVSNIGRFLEHSRIYYFRNDLSHDVYCSSADWMSRNLYRRIEVAFPILDAKLKKRVIEEGLQTYLKDNTHSWLLKNTGEYDCKKPRSNQTPFTAQLHLMELLGHVDFNVDVD